MRLNAARRAVLETTKILECILSFLPPKQLFGVQSVAHLWKDVICSSPAIPEKQFLRLQNKPAELWAMIECGLRADGFVFMQMEKITPDVKPTISNRTAGGKKFTPVALNSFLQLSDDPDYGRDGNNSCCNRTRHSVPEITRFCDGLIFDPNSSLLDTYISDPPCLHARITSTYFSSPPRPNFKKFELSASVHNGEALTLWHVVPDTWMNVKCFNVKEHMKIYHENDRFPHRDGLRHPNPEFEQQYEENEVTALTSLADVIRDLESKHHCKFDFSLQHSSIRLDSHSDAHDGPFPIVPTNAEKRAVVSHDKSAHATLMSEIEAEKAARAAKRPSSRYDYALAVWDEARKVWGFRSGQEGDP